MERDKSLQLGSLTALAVVSFVSFLPAQQIVGTVGSPSATTTIDGKQLPAPDPKFGGVIKDDALKSTPWWAPRIVPPKEAPNVLLIITDDAGFGVPSTFGGVIPTPTMDRIARPGAALQPGLLHRAVLADPGGADHRTQSPLGRFRCDLRTVHRDSPATTASSPRTRRPSAAFCWTMATRRRGLAKITTRPLSRPVRSGRSTSGPPVWASSTSTASSAATRISGSRTCFATRRRFIRLRASRDGT